jgi:hypothetical protein
MNNWKAGEHCPPSELFREAEAFAFLGANGYVHHESLNLESLMGKKYFEPLTQFYRTPKTTETGEK